MKLLIAIILIINLSTVDGFSQIYFQQKTNYHIKVQLDDSLKMLRGNITITYTNQSDDTLKLIRFHLWPNAYSGRNTALCDQLIESKETGLFFATDQQKGWIESLNFQSEGITLQLIPDREHTDIADLQLKKPLLPGEAVELTSPFVVKIPDSRFSRFGYHKNSFYISQWFPKPAVYDQQGWHPMPYLNQGEFYAEFGKFRVEITLPSEYRVAGTGRLLNVDESEWLNKLSSGNLVPNPAGTPFKTLIFEQDSIHDFAWFADQDYQVLKKSVRLPGSERAVDAMVFHGSKGDQYWKKSMDYIEHGLKYFSETIGEYPYDHFTVVDGHLAAGGGMEYPMITLINSPASDASLEHVIVHEMCHNWFYGMLATNEREFAWMDEGFTSFYETQYFEHRYSGQELVKRSSTSETGLLAALFGAQHLTPLDDHKLTYKLAASGNNDQPIQTPAADFTGLNYAGVVYSKSVLALSFLQDYLGRDIFNRCVKAYFSEWKFKHPYPENLQLIFEKESGKNLAWFFDGMLKSNRPEYYKLKHSHQNSNVKSLTIQSESPSLVPLIVENDKGDRHLNEGFSGSQQMNISFLEDTGLRFNPGHEALLKAPDRYVRNTGGFRFPSLKFRGFYKLHDDFASENLIVFPVATWNRYNSWMAGIHLTNMDLIPEKTEFFLTPLFDFKNKQFGGTGAINHHIYPYSGIFSSVSLSLAGKRFAYDQNRLHSDTFPGSKPVFMYSTIAPSVRLFVRKDKPRSPKQQMLMFRNVTVWQDEIRYTANASGYDRDYISTTQNFSEAGYEILNNSAIDPWSFHSTLQYGNEHLKLSAELNYRLSYKKRNKGFDIRVFAGGFLRNETTDRNYNFRMSGWKGRDDYLYDEIYFGRNDDRGLWPNQFLVKDGGFKIATAIGQTRDWLASVNLQADLPLPLPLKFYFDIGTFEGITTIIEGESKVVMYNGGLAVSLIRNTIEVYVPLFYSSDIKRNLEVNNVSFAERIRFVLNLRNLAPVKLRDDLINSMR